MGEKLYYSISEVSRLLGEKESLLRFWERTFPMLRPKRGKKGRRQFMSKDISMLRTIHHLVRDKGYTLDGAKQELLRTIRRQKEQQQLLSQLQELRGFLVRIREGID